MDPSSEKLMDTKNDPGCVIKGAELGWVEIPSGSFFQGSTAAEVQSMLRWHRGIDPTLFVSEIGRVETHVSDFRLARYPVTNGQYREFVNQDGYLRQEFWSTEGWDWRTNKAILFPKFFAIEGWSSDCHPMIGVSWFEAEAFARWAGARLPTEQEWEWAARGHQGLLYPWGAEFELNRCNSAEFWMNRRPKDHPEWQTAFFEKTPWRNRVLTTEIGSFPQGVSPSGIHDMAGNVFEWVQDWFEKDWYSQGADRTPSGPTTGVDKVCRGGSFGYPSWCTRTTDRGHHTPDHRSLGLGFRLAQTF